MASVITDPPVPYVGRIAGGFPEGKIIRIQGYTSPDSQRFNINLQTGPDSESDDIAVHVSVRLHEGYVARNSFSDGEWGEEQGEGTLPIGTGQKFEILLLSAANNYKIAINGQHFCEFPHRIRPGRISHLSVDGDVKIALISHEGGDQESKTSSTQQNSMFSGQQNNYGGYGPPPQQGYGPNPQQGYGPPPQQGYGPPPGYGGYNNPYGGPQQGYNVPGAPPGHQPESGLENFLETAGSVIAGAISSGMADKLIGSLTGGGQQQPQGGHHPQQQQHHQQPHQSDPQSPSFHLPQMGGQGSLGGLGSIGSLLGNLASEVLQPKRNPPTAPSAPSAPPMSNDSSATRKPLYPQFPNPVPPVENRMQGTPFPSSGPAGGPPPPGISLPPHPPTYPQNPASGGYPPPLTPAAIPFTQPHNPPGYHQPTPTSNPYPTQPTQPHYPANTYNNPAAMSGAYTPRASYHGYPQYGSVNTGPYPVHVAGAPNPSNVNSMGSVNPAYSGAGGGYQRYGAQPVVMAPEKGSSTMDKVKKYGLPILGAGVATYAISQVLDGFGGSDSDSD